MWLLSMLLCFLHAYVCALFRLHSSVVLSLSFLRFFLSSFAFLIFFVSSFPCHLYRFPLLFCLMLLFNFLKLILWLLKLIRRSHVTPNEEEKRIRKREKKYTTKVYRSNKSNHALLKRVYLNRYYRFKQTIMLLNVNLICSKGFLWQFGFYLKGLRIKWKYNRQNQILKVKWQNDRGMEQKKRWKKQKHTR